MRYTLRCKTPERGAGDSPAGRLEWKDFELVFEAQNRNAAILVANALLLRLIKPLGPSGSPVRPLSPMLYDESSTVVWDDRRNLEVYAA